MESGTIKLYHTVKYQEFPELIFGESEEGYQYFDASRYIIQKGDIKRHTVKEFRFAFSIWSDAICKTYEINPGYLIIEDTNTGHVFIEESMALLFIAYIDPYFGVYILERMNELFLGGFTLSDTALLLLTKERFNEDVLKPIDKQDEEK